MSTPERPVRLHITKHPDKSAKERFEGLVGIDEQKADLIEYLVGVLAPERLRAWEKKHHPRGLAVLRRVESRPPLVVLAGDVGAGKTELATSVGTPVAQRLQDRVQVFETPSDIRGGGHVGELSLRVTAAFEHARQDLGDKKGLLIIDEGDDLATSREQNQAHHEDRAGMNVLIKQIDALARDRLPLAVILITNRFAALDPALVRRAHVIRFVRPSTQARRAFFEETLGDLPLSVADLNALMAATEREIPFTFSDLITRIIEPALRRAVRYEVALTIRHLIDQARDVEPTPVFADTGV